MGVEADHRKMGVRADCRKRGELATENGGISWPHKEGGESWAKKLGVGVGHRKRGWEQSTDNEQRQVNKTYLNSLVRNNSPVSSLYTSWASSVTGFTSFFSLHPVVEGINQ